MTTLVPIALSLLLQSTGLLLLGLLALRLTHSRGPAVQTLIGRSALAGVALLLLLAPLTGHVHPLWRVTLEPTAAKPTPPRSSAPLPLREGQESRTSPGPSFREEEDKTASQQGAAIDQGAASSAPTPVMPPLRPPLWGEPLRSEGRTSKVVGSYAAITLTLLLWLAVCQWHLTRLRRTATLLTSGPAAELLDKLTPHPPLLLTHPSVRSPFLAGLVRPAIFLPPTYAADFDPAALRAILAHELAHLQRRDNAWTLAMRLLCALLWPQPLLWLLCRHLEQIAEDACDSAVLAQHCPPRAYADCLLTLAERYPLPRRQRALGAGVAPYRSSLGRRVQRILTQGKQTMLPLSTKLRLTIAALTLAAVLGGVCLVSSAPAQVTADRVSPAPTQIQAASLIGTWLCSQADGIGTVLIFSKNGNVEEVGPWPGESREVGHSYSSNSAVGHSYGHYTVSGSKLKYTFTRVWVEGGKPWSSGPEKHTMDYTLSGDTLTLRWNGNRVAVSHRVPAYTKAMLGLKPNTSPEAQLYAKTNQQLSQARFLAGLTAVQGPGVIVTLRDSKRPYPHPLPPGLVAPNIIHDSDINQVVNELRSAGAEAISVNDQRLVATSAVRCAGPLVYVNNNPQTPPYTIKVIGNSTAMLTVLKCPGGIASQVQNFDPAMFDVKESKMLDLPAFKGEDSPHYAKPLTSNLPQTTEAKPVQPVALTPLELRQKTLQLQVVRDQLATRQAATKLQTIYAHLRDKGFFVQANPDGSLRSVRVEKWKSPAPPTTDENTPQIRILDQEIALQIANIARLEGQGYTPKHPEVIGANAQLQTLETARRELPIKAKKDFVKDVHAYSRQWVALYNEIVGSNLPLVAANRQLARDQNALKLLTMSIQTEKRLQPH